MRLLPLLFVLSTAALGGCIFSPEQKPPKPIIPPGYPPRTSPQNALYYMVLAYVDRDSTRTDSVYDEHYAGTSTDLSAPIPTVQFTKENEVRHVGHLKLDPYIVTVYLDLGDPSSWIRLPPDAGDDPTWAVIQRNAQTVRIEDISRATTWESTNNQITYTFKPTATGAPGESLWTIVKWTEYANNN